MLSPAPALVRAILGIDAARLFRRKNAFLNQPLAKVDAVIEIDLKDDDGGPTGWRPAHQHRTVPAKMP